MNEGDGDDDFEGPSSRAPRDGRSQSQPCAPKPLLLSSDIVQCTACKDQINVNLRKEFVAHPELQVIVCKKCHRFLTNGEWKKDQNGEDEYCRWCGHGGQILICDICKKHGFCKNCLCRNFGRRYATAAMEATWWCFICDASPLLPLQEQYKSFVARLELNGRHYRTSKRRRVPATPSTVDRTVGCRRTGSPLIETSVAEEEGETSEPKGILLPSLLRRTMNWSLSLKKLSENMQKKLNAPLDKRNLDRKLEVSTAIIGHLKEAFGEMKRFCERMDESLNGNVCVPVGTAADGGQPTIAIIPKPGEHPNLNAAADSGETNDTNDVFTRPATKKRPRLSTRKPSVKKQRLEYEETAASTADGEKSGCIVNDSKAIFSVEPRLVQSSIDGAANSENGVSSTSGATVYFDGKPELPNSSADQRTTTDDLPKAASTVSTGSMEFESAVATNDQKSGEEATTKDADERTSTDSLGSVLNSLGEDVESDIGAGHVDKGSEVNLAKDISDGNGETDDNVDSSRRVFPVADGEGNGVESLNTSNPEKEQRSMRDESEQGEEEVTCLNEESDGSSPAGLDGEIEALPSDGEEIRLDPPSNTESANTNLGSARDAVMRAFSEDDSDDEKDVEDGNLLKSDLSSPFDGDEIDERDDVDNSDNETEKSDHHNHSGDDASSWRSKDSHMISRPRTNQPKKDRANTEEGFDPELEKQMQVLTRGLRYEIGKKASSDDKQMSKTGTSKKKSGAQETLDSEESASGDEIEEADVQEGGEKKFEGESISKLWEFPTTELKPAEESNTARNAVLAELENDSGSSSDDSTTDGEIGDATASVRSKENKVIRPPRDDSDEKNFIDLASDSDHDDAADVKPKSKHELRRMRLLRTNIFRTSGTKSSERMIAKPPTLPTPLKRKQNVVWSSDDEESSASGSSDISVERSCSDNDSCVLVTSDEEPDKPHGAKAIVKVKEELSLSQISVHSGVTGSPAKTNFRRNIRPLKEGSETTRQAEAAEMERRRRIAQLSDSQSASKSYETEVPGATLGRSVILDKDADPVVSVHSVLSAQLKPHQVDGVQFLYKTTIESIKRKDKDGNGCILAHCMGLGKTFQVISYLHAIMVHPILKTTFRTALVVVPKNVILNWKDEFGKWLQGCPKLWVTELLSAKSEAARLTVLECWKRDGGVLIIGYAMFRNLASGKTVKSSGQKERFAACLLNPGPDVIICDEGHILKSDKTGISVVINGIRTKRRICLTGTPLQNYLSEYHCMIQFVKPNLLGSKKEFKNRFENPIKNGQCIDSTPDDVRLMKRRAHILHSLVEGFVHRLDYSVLTPVLPPRHEYVLMVRLSPKQTELYRGYLNIVVGSVDIDSLRARKMLFSDFQALQRVCAHPLSLKIHFEQKMYEKKSADFVVENLSDQTASSSASDDEPVDENGDPAMGASVEAGIAKNATRHPERLTSPLEIAGWWKNFISEQEISRPEISGKLALLMEIIWKCEQLGEKLLVFSQSLLTIDVIEQFLKMYDSFIDLYHSESDRDKAHHEARRKLRWEWKLGSDYFRIDGQTTAQNRKRYIQLFNDEDNKRCRLFLMTTRAGGIGTNLAGANRVVIFDASWNPSNDAQGTMEDVIYDRQVTKQSLALRVVDEHQVERHFTMNDLQELYAFRPADAVQKGNVPIAPVPKDSVLADLLLDQKEHLITYHEHDSLLRNVEEEKLTEDEKKAAWADYEREGRGAVELRLLERCILAEPDISRYVDAAAQMLRDNNETFTMNDILANLIRESPQIFEHPKSVLKMVKEVVIKLRKAAMSRQQPSQPVARVYQADYNQPSTSRSGLPNATPTSSIYPTLPATQGPFVPQYLGVYNMPNYEQMPPDLRRPILPYAPLGVYSRMEAPRVQPRFMDHPPDRPG